MELAAIAAAQMAAAALLAPEAVEVVDTMPEPEFVRIRDIQPALAWAILAGLGLACAIAGALALMAGR